MAAFEKEAAGKVKELSGLLRGTEAEALMNRGEEITREFSDATKSDDAERMNAVGKKGQEINEKIWALVHQAASKTAPRADSPPGIELTAAQQQVKQQLEKTLADVLETQAALAARRSEMKETHPAVVELKAKLRSLEQQAELLRGFLTANKTRPHEQPEPSAH